LEFEKPLVELEQKIEELRSAGDDAVNFDDEVVTLKRKADTLRESIYAKLTPWQVVQLSRHSARPYTLDYVDALCTDFVELRGDRAYRDDQSIVGGIGYFNKLPLMIIGHQKGRNTKENMIRNFGMPRPEGYRKAQRLMNLAERFSMPILTLIDTPGAYPGIGAEERGQSEAIATSIQLMTRLKTPIISVVIGEGGSGGALALGVSDRIYMLRYSTYSVISPEGCASILWKDGRQASVAAGVLKLRATDIHNFGICDKIIDEPTGGIHRDPGVVYELLRDILSAEFSSLCALSTDALLEQRYDKFRAIGAFQSVSA